MTIVDVLKTLQPEEGISFTPDEHGGLEVVIHNRKYAPHITICGSVLAQDNAEEDLSGVLSQHLGFLRDFSQRDSKSELTKHA